MNICEMTRRKIIMGKRATRIAACVLAGVMAMQMLSLIHISEPTRPY